MRTLRPLASRSMVALALLFACGREHAHPPRPVPSPDGRPPLLSPGARSPRIASYVIDAEYDAQSHRLRATERLTWRNTGQTAVGALPFHLYMNAFKNDQSVFMREARRRHPRFRPRDRGWGDIQVTRIAVGASGDLRPQARFPGPDETVLELPLPAPVAPGASVDIALDFDVQLPEVFARTGYKGEFAMVAQWFPKIGVRIGEPGKERWHCEPFHLMSEFFADFGTYDVTLTVPASHTVAATGVLAEATATADGRHRLRYRAEDVHDFAWAIDPYMETIAATAHTDLGDVEVRVHHRPSQREYAERHLRAGVSTIELMSRMYLPYPWATMSIIDPPIGAERAGGMEYPTLVTTAGDGILSPPGVRLPEFVTVHEVGHNWFQGILASNEVDEAWLDEGVNEYSNGIVMSELYGEDAAAIDRYGLRAGYFELRQASALPLGALPDPIETVSYRFVDPFAYARATYAKTALAMKTLENLHGAPRFRAAMQVYAREFAFRHPTGPDLWTTLERELGEDLDWFVEPAFRRTGVADLRVRDAHCTRKPRSDSGASVPPPWACDVVVINLGEVRVPVDVEIVFEDGSRLTRRWDGMDRWHRFELEHRSRIASVTIDPGDEILIDDSGTASSWRRRADPSASRRAAAGAQFWTQSLMQAVGL